MLSPTLPQDHQVFVILRRRFRFQYTLWVTVIEETYILMSCSKFSPSLCAPTLPSALSEELNAAALVPMEALLLQLLPFRPFADVVLQPDLREFRTCPLFKLFLQMPWQGWLKLHSVLILILILLFIKQPENNSLSFLTAGLSPEHELPQCLLLVNALGQLSSQTEEVLQLWYSGSQFSEETPR